VVDRDTLDLLEALTEADARATSTQAWTAWRAGLVRRLADQVRSELAGGQVATHWDADDVEVPDALVGEPGHVHVAVETNADGMRITVAVADRAGLMAAVAGALALLRTSVRSARVGVRDGVGVSVWEVAEQSADAAVLAQRIGAVLSGALDPASRLRLPPPALPPVVEVHPDASQCATVLEVRTEDRPGVVWAVCAALAGLGLDVRSAHVATVGPQARDVFYVRRLQGGPLREDDAAGAVLAVRRALDARGAGTQDMGPAVTLDA
jgi:[protein-PII] uridylyltransferase